MTTRCRKCQRRALAMLHMEMERSFDIVRSGATIHEVMGLVAFFYQHGLFDSLADYESIAGEIIIDL